MRALVSGFALLVGCKDAEEAAPVPPPPPPSHPAPSSEALARKARSIATLEREGVKVMKDLPVIATVAESTSRERDAIVDRAVALMLVGTKSEGLEQVALDKIRDTFGASGFLSPHEQAYLAKATPSTADNAAFNWRYEGLGVMLWALQLDASLPSPDQMVDAGHVVKEIMDKGAAALRAQARPRTMTEILDADDLYYRYDWACTNARVHRKPAPAALNCEVVQERHYALNWLIGYQHQAWDDVSTDT